jgi:hypothetical protein
MMLRRDRTTCIRHSDFGSTVSARELLFRFDWLYTIRIGQHLSASKMSLPCNIYINYCELYNHNAHVAVSRIRSWSSYTRYASSYHTTHLCCLLLFSPSSRLDIETAYRRARPVTSLHQCQYVFLDSGRQISHTSGRGIPEPSCREHGHCIPSPRRSTSRTSHQSAAQCCRCCSQRCRGRWTDRRPLGP